MIVLLILFLGGAAGVLAEELQCYHCEYLTASDFCVQDIDTPKSCPQGIGYCSIGATAHFTTPDGTKASALQRECALPDDAKENDRLWSKLPSGYKYICESTDSGSGTSESETPNRICLCNTPLCNGASWDEIMVQPVMKHNYADGDVAQVQPLGSRSYRNFFNFTTRGPFRSGNLSDTRGSSGELTTSSPSGTGLGIGAIVGIVLGALTFLALILAIIIICCRRYQRKKKKKKKKPTEEDDEDDTGASRSSRTSGIIGEGKSKHAASEKAPASSGTEYIDRHTPKPLPDGPVGGESSAASQGGPKVFWGETYQ